MAKGHPVDALGRVLPHSSWPPERQTTGELEFVRRFCNSVNRENGAERFLSAAQLDAWLLGERAAPIVASDAELHRIVHLRDAIRAVIVDGSGTASLLASCDGVRFEPVAADTGVRLAPVGSAAERLTGRLLLAIITATQDGRWRRLKACQHCQWIVFDPSKNASSRWCSMSACGGRHNARQYRLRRAEQAT